MSHRTSRGFLWMDPIPGDYGEVVVYESSVAFDPHIWLRALMPEDLNAAALGEHTEWVEARVHLSVENARLLRDRIDELLRNHFYGDQSHG